MRRLVRMGIALVLAAGSALAEGTGCVAIEKDRITATDMAKALPGFTSVAPDTPVGFAPVPGVRRTFLPADLQRLAARFHLAIQDAGAICFERALEPLARERVADAMRQALNDPAARVEIVELSGYPVPHGEIQFPRTGLMAAQAAPALWRGFVRYDGEKRFRVWARVRLSVRSTRIVATESLDPGRPIQARQVRLEQCETFPSDGPAPLTLEAITGKVPRRPIPAGSVVDGRLLDEPHEVESGDLVRVEVRSGAARLELEGRAQSTGRRGEAIRVRNLSSGKSFVARVSDRGRAELAPLVPPKANP